MAESVDVADLKSVVRKGVGVRVPPVAPPPNVEAINGGEGSPHSKKDVTRPWMEHLVRFLFRFDK